MSRSTSPTAIALSALFLSTSAFAQQPTTPRPVNAGGGGAVAMPVGCVQGLDDQANPGYCIPAATIPTLGMLYPMSSAFFIDYNGHEIGMGTTTPTASLHMVSPQGVLAEGPYAPNSTTLFPTVTAGPRMHFITHKAAFRAGYGTGGTWEGNQVGNFSAAFGTGTIASGDSSTAFGNGSVASGYSSTAMGKNTDATGFYSLASGLSALASGDHSVSLGVSTHATGYSAVAFGSITESNGTCSLVQGINSVANGDCSMAVGLQAVANSYASVAIGRSNVGGGNPNTWVATDPIFEVGVGNGGSTLANALTVLKNSRVGIGTPIPTVPLQVQGGNDASPTAGGYLQLGHQSTTNLILDDNEILARNNGAVGTLSLNNNGGNVNISASGTGRVAIGHGSAAFTLDVNGTAGKPGGGSWSVSSDLRLKRNVKDLDGSLAKLLELRGVTFEYNDPAAIGELPGERIGFIAQEVEQVFPDWVGQKDDGMKFLTVRGFEALSVEALRELDARQARLEAENTRLREELAAERLERERASAELRELLAEVREQARRR
ncbi:MAG: tail fiber domain-containing protein [Planctomycetota bacterium]|nr:tail fiber domain-containing protein [Planctomycetota bacterium]